jgi:hypothetical protein
MTLTSSRTIAATSKIQVQLLSDFEFDRVTIQFRPRNPHLERLKHLSG